MGLTKDGQKTVHYVLFSAIYSIIYRLVSFSPDGIQEGGGLISPIALAKALQAIDFKDFLFQPFEDS